MNNISFLLKLREMAWKGLACSERADLLAIVCVVFSCVSLLS